MGGGGQSGPQTTTSVQEIPKYVQPYAKHFLRRAKKESLKKLPPYAGQRVAGLTPYHEQALDIGGQAMGGALPTGMETLTRAAGGEFMGANPYLDAAFNRAAGNITGQMANTMRMQGLTNAGMAQAQERQMTDLANQMYGGQYQRDMANMLSAAQGLPSYATQAAQFGLGLGDVPRSYQQDLINARMQQFAEKRAAPLERLDILGRGLGMSMGAGGTTTTTAPGPYRPSPMAGMLGTGLGLAGLFGGLF